MSRPTRTAGWQAWLAVALLGVIATAPASHAAGASPFPAGPLLAPSVHFRFGVCFLPKAPPTLPKALAELLKRDFPTLAPKVNLVPTRDATALGAGESLEYFARTLSTERRAELSRSQQTLTLDFDAPGASSRPLLRQAYRLLLALGKAHKAVLWDDETREWLEPKLWQERRVDGWAGAMPTVESHMLTHFYRDDEGYRAVTLGMRKFGLPDLVVNDLLQSDGERVMVLLNLAARAMAVSGKMLLGGRLLIDLDALAAVEPELKDMTFESKARRTELILAIGKREPGDPDNRLAEVTFPGDPDKGVHQRQALLLNKLFGSSQRGITPFSREDPELGAASARAKAKLPSVAARFRKGLPVGQRLVVKGPFAAAGDATEWMWVEVATWRGHRIHGTLLNEPDNIPSLSEGSEVDLSDEDLFDYMLVGPGDAHEGGETNDIAMRRAKKD